MPALLVVTSSAWLKLPHPQQRGCAGPSAILPENKTTELSGDKCCQISPLLGV